jgi:predicted transglutaminase-like protease
MANGGRPGFKFGTGKQGVKGLLEMLNKKFGKDVVKTADKVTLTDEMLFEKDNKRLLEELKDYKEVAPKFYQRMSLKLKYPGISDDLIEKIMADDDPQRIAEVMATMDEGLKMMEKGMGTDEIISTFKKTPRTKNAGGGLNYLMGM